MSRRMASGCIRLASASPVSPRKATTALNPRSRAISSSTRAKVASSSTMSSRRSFSVTESRSSFSSLVASTCPESAAALDRVSARPVSSALGTGNRPPSDRPLAAPFSPVISSSEYSAGRYSVNTLPCPGSLSMRISPPRSRVSSRLIDSPSPVPP